MTATLDHGQELTHLHYLSCVPLLQEVSQTGLLTLARAMREIDNRAKEMCIRDSLPDRIRLAHRHPYVGVEIVHTCLLYTSRCV